LIDEGTGTKYGNTAHAHQGSTVTIPVGGSIEIWVKYTMPEGEIPKYLTAALPYGVLLEHLEVPQ